MFDLQNVVISVPLPSLREAPSVSQIDGEWRCGICFFIFFSLNKCQDQGFCILHWTLLKMSWFILKSMCVILTVGNL